MMQPANDEAMVWIDCDDEIESSSDEDVLEASESESEDEEEGKEEEEHHEEENKEEGEDAEQEGHSTAERDTESIPSKSIRIRDTTTSTRHAAEEALHDLRAILRPRCKGKRAGYRDPEFPATLRDRLLRMATLLNFYTSKVSEDGERLAWGVAAFRAAKLQGRQEYYTRKLKE